MTIEAAGSPGGFFCAFRFLNQEMEGVNRCFVTEKS